MSSNSAADYDLLVELSQCCFNFATVYLAKCKSTGQHVALKKYCLDKANKEESQLVHQEILVMRQLNHPNLHNFYTSFMHDAYLHVVSPFMLFGSCKDTMLNCFNTGLPEIFIALIMRDVLAGLDYLHRQSYVHRAIRASHILLSPTKAVLTGFRETTNVLSHGKRYAKLHALAKLSKNSLNWLAPEVLEQNVIGYTEKSDIYSIGITCCELANGIEPFVNAQPTFMLIEKVHGNVPALLDQSTCPFVNNEFFGNGQSSQVQTDVQQIYMRRTFSPDFHQFSEICLNKNAANRWTAFELQSHSFLKQCRHTSLLNQFQRYGIDILDTSQIKDKDLALCNGINDLSVKSDDFEWNF